MKESVFFLFCSACLHLLLFLSFGKGSQEAAGGDYVPLKVQIIKKKNTPKVSRLDKKNPKPLPSHPPLTPKDSKPLLETQASSEALPQKEFSEAESKEAQRELEEIESSLSSSSSRGLIKDLSSSAQLIAFEAPEYTEEALESELTGEFIVRVLVSSEGKVLEAELEEAVGYGMDELLLEASRAALFSPQRDQVGRPLSVWTQIHIQLEMD